ncbi:MAG: O-antigen ligase family protein [Candidatus Eisenbacteria bacterium]
MTFRDPAMDVQEGRSGGPFRLLEDRRVQTILLGILVATFAIFAGMQIASPDKRVIQVLAAMLLVFFAFRIDSVSALAIATLLLPFPKATSYGNTNVTFVLLIFVVWLFRVSTKRLPPPVRLPSMLPVLLLVMSYAISFYNVEYAHYAIAWAKFMAFLSYLFLAYLVVNVVRTEADVKKIFLAQLVSSVLVLSFGIYELNHPGGAIIPGWIEFTDTVKTGVGVRIGSTFLDYELFGEYCALNLMFQIFLFTRATSKSRKFVLAGIMLLTFYCLFATVTRGALLTMFVGLTYLTWMSRTRVTFPKLVIGVAGLVAVFAGGDFIVSSFSKSGSVLTRLEKTEFVGGVPDSRVGAWEYATKYISQQPLIGHGTYYSIEKGLETKWWPHNVYLYYASIVGLIGLAWYLWFLWEMFKLSRPRAPSLGEGSYLQGARLAMRVMLVMFMADQLKIEYLRNERYSFFIWFFFGLVVAVSHAAQRESIASNEGVLALPSSEPRRPTAVRSAVSARSAVLPGTR